MSASKRKGTAWESAIVGWLSRWNPQVERRTLNGNKDRGDIAGIPGVVIEAKATKTALLAKYVDEAAVEAENDGARIGVVWMKRTGYTSPGDGYVVMDGITFTRLLIDAGYLPKETDVHDA